MSAVERRLREGKILFGVLTTNWLENDEFAAAIGIRTSNDKSMPLILCAGASVFVCTNMCFSGDEIVLNRRHTKHLDLDVELARALDRYQEGALRLNEDIATLKRFTMTEDEGKQYIYDMFRH